MTAVPYDFKRGPAGPQSSGSGRLFAVLSRMFSSIEAVFSAFAARIRKQRKREQTALRLVSRCAVSGRSSVAVVDWEGQRFLVGVGAESVSVITPMAARPADVPGRIRQVTPARSSDSGLKISLNDWVEEREQTAGLGVRGGRKRGISVYRAENGSQGSGVRTSPEARRHTRYGQRRHKRVHASHSPGSARRDGQR